MQKLREYLFKPKERLLCHGFALVLLGGLFFMIDYRHQKRYNWKSVLLPFQVEAGDSVQGSFVAELSQAHEVQLEFHPNIPYEEMDTLVLSIDEPSPLDINWKVLHKSETVAEGTCQEYLYIDYAPDSLIRRIKRKVFKLLHFAEMKRGDRHIRGVGKFRCEKGERYEIQATVGKTIAKLAATDPIFCVRINRRFAKKYFEATVRLGKLGSFLLGFSLLIFIWCTLVTIATKISHNRNRQNAQERVK